MLLKYVFFFSKSSPWVQSHQIHRSIFRVRIQKSSSSFPWLRILAPGLGGAADRGQRSNLPSRGINSEMGWWILGLKCIFYLIKTYDHDEYLGFCILFMMINRDNVFCIWCIKDVLLFFLWLQRFRPGLGVTGARGRNNNEFVLNSTRIS